MNHPKTILHVPRRFVAHEWGGTETVITEIAKQQQLAGGAPKIVTSLALTGIRNECVHGIPVQRHSYSYPFFGLTSADKLALDKKGGNLLSLSLFWSLMREPDVRIFHAHSLKRLGGEVATAARLRKKPFVVTLHGGVFDVPGAELADMTRPIEGKFEWGRPFGALFGSRTVLDQADMVVCVGLSEMEAAKRQLGHERITYLPNGVDSARFAEGNGARFRVLHDIPKDAFLVMNISRIDSQKNQELLLTTFAEVHRQDPNTRLVMIGPETQPAYAKKLRELIISLGLQDGALILPGMANDDPSLLDAFAACDTFVLPSRHEPFGIVVLEAWSAGKAVIASRTGGLKTLIDDGRTGMLFDVESPESQDQLGSLMMRLHRYPSLRRKLAEAGRSEARESYDWHRIHRQLEQVYEAAEEHCRSRFQRNQSSKAVPSPCI